MLLEQVQVITGLLGSEGIGVNMEALVGALRDALGGSAVYLANRKGKVVAYALPEALSYTPFDREWLGSGQFPDHLASGVLKVGAISSGAEARRVTGVEHSAIFPVMGAGRRVGTLLLVRAEGEFSDEELVLGEVTATAAGLVMAAALDEEEADEAKARQMARAAVRNLSYSEVLAMQHIFDELKGDEGLLVASRIADQAGITRSVIVNALRKLSSANVVESRSLGMKGTYLRLLNREIRHELNRQRFTYPVDGGSAGLLVAGGRRHSG